MQRSYGQEARLNRFFGELERDWAAIDKGMPTPEPVHRVYFESAEALPGLGPSNGDGQRIRRPSPLLEVQCTFRVVARGERSVLT